MNVDGLPCLPGNSYPDATKMQFHRSQTLGFTNGYSMKKRPTVGIGGTSIYLNQLSESELDELAKFNPQLTYGRTKLEAPAPFIPAFVALDKKILRYHALYKGTVHDKEPCGEERKVDILYYLVDDSMMVTERPEDNGGLFQGKLLNRQRMPKTDAGESYSWKDLNVGSTIVLYGRVFEIYGCDAWSREWLTSEGIIVNPSTLEDANPESDEFDHLNTNGMTTCNGRGKANGKMTEIDKLRKFLELDRKVLRFYAVWDTRDEMFGDVRQFIIHYYLVDDTVEVLEVHKPNDGRDPFPLLISRHRIPRDRGDIPPTFPLTVMELSEEEINEFISPSDLGIGKIVQIYNRRFFIYDMDDFTKAYYWKYFGITDFTPAEYDLGGKKIAKREVLDMEEEDLMLENEKSIHSCRTLLMKRPTVDLSDVPNNLQLRYEAILDSPKKEDDGRRFIITLGVLDGMMMIYEPPIKNSGFVGGKFLERTRVAKPGSHSERPNFYDVRDFYVGAVIEVFRRRFIVTNADEQVLTFMTKHSELFEESQVRELRERVRNRPSSALQRDSVTYKRPTDKKTDLEKVIEQVRSQLKRLAITGHVRKDAQFLGVEMNRAGFIDKNHLRDMCIRQQLPCDDEIIDGLASRIGKDPERITLEELRDFLEDY